MVELVFITKHLAMMVKAGLPVAEGLETVAMQIRHPGLRKAVENISKSVKNGSSLHKSLSQYPRFFDAFYAGFIRVGESSGTLKESLDYLAGELEANYQLRQKIRSAAAYPLFVTAIALGVGGFIAFAVLPQLVGFFQGFSIELPLSTRVLLIVARFMRDWGAVVLATLIGVLAILAVTVTRPAVRPHWDALLLRLPFFGEVLLWGQLAQLSRNAGLMLHAGIPITEALQVAGSSVRNKSLQKDFDHASNLVEKGSELAKAWKKLSNHRYGKFYGRMLEVGEKTGSLEQSFMYLSEYYTRELDTATARFSTIVEPLLLVIVGLLVGFVALAIIAPIYELTGVIR